MLKKLIQDKNEELFDDAMKKLDTKDEVVKEEIVKEKELSMETKEISREGDVGIEFNDPIMVPETIK